jgi:hypothetical protein
MAAITVPKTEDRERVVQRGAADALCGVVRVRDLERHPDRQREVGEVNAEVTR